MILLAVFLQAPVVRAQNRELPNAVYAKVSLIDYGALYNHDLRIGEGFEFAYFRNLGNYINLGFPIKVGLAKLPNQTENVVTTGVDAVLQFTNTAPDIHVQPYISVGAGYVLEQFDNGHAQLPVAFGINFRVSRFAYFTVQGEYRKALIADRDNLQLGAGFMTLLHKSVPRVVLPPDADKDGTPDNVDQCPTLPGPAVARGCPDGDNDGVADMDDQCPTEPGTAELRGCPDYDKDGVTDAEDECPTDFGTVRGCPDADGDGIADKADKCPTEVGTAENKGCPGPRDSDGDGIPDDKDLCPTIAGSNNGCPDTDGDGIADNFDKCPTVAGLPDNSGCPEKDTDGDGLPDKLDKCPTMAGLASNSGCPQIKQETKERLAFATKAVQFETAKAVLKNQSFAILDELIGILREYPDYKLSISGHTDEVGEDARNLVLSMERAKACADYLIFKGIQPERLRTAGFGEVRPIASNRTVSGRELNRRVEFELIVE